jgi:hypothetical protein
MAMVGTTAIEIPGTPVFDIPVSIAQIAINVQSKYDKEKLAILADMILIFWFDWI